MSVAGRAWIGLVVVLLLVACSERLAGERVEESIEDWSFVHNVADVTFATADGQRFRAVEVGHIVADGELYLHAQTIFRGSDATLDAVLAGAPLEMQVDGRVYPLEATYLTEAADIERVLPILVRDGMRIDATGIRWQPDSPRYPGTQMRQWYFRLESAQAANPDR